MSPSGAYISNVLNGVPLRVPDELVRGVDFGETSSGTLSIRPGRIFFSPAPLALKRAQWLYLRACGGDSSTWSDEVRGMAPGQAAKQYFHVLTGFMGHMSVLAAGTRVLLAASVFEAAEDLHNFEGLETMLLTSALALDETTVPLDKKKLTQALFQRFPKMWEILGDPPSSARPSDFAVTSLVPVLHAGTATIEFLDRSAIGPIGSAVTSLPDLRGQLKNWEVIPNNLNAAQQVMIENECKFAWKWGSAIVGGTIGAVVGAAATAPVGGAGAGLGAIEGAGAGALAGEFFGDIFCDGGDKDSTKSSSQGTSSAGASNAGTTVAAGGTGDSGSSPDTGTDAAGTPGGTGDSSGDDSGGDSSNDDDDDDVPEEEADTDVGYPNPMERSAVYDTVTLVVGGGMNGFLVRNGAMVAMTALPQLTENARNLRTAGFLASVPSIAAMVLPERSIANLAGRLDLVASRPLVSSISSLLRGMKQTVSSQIRRVQR